MPTSLANLRVALVHDWLLTYRGGERILGALCELFPDAPIFTLFYQKGSVGQEIESHPIYSSFLNRTRLGRRLYRHLLPLYPMAIERFKLSGFDLVISSSHCAAKGVIVDPDTLHVCYTHTPMRYAWDHYHDYFNGKLEPLMAFFLHYLRQWDVTSSARVDHFIANSNWVKKRIWKYYRRQADVVYPFVDLSKFTMPSSKSADYYLVVSAFAPYKRIDLAIEACRKMDRRLLVVGSGQIEDRLKKSAGKKTEFLGSLDGPELAKIYQNASALLFPGEEDFGITPLEAMASGTPVIGFGRGGLRESMIPEKTGIFFHSQTVQSICEAMDQFESGTHMISPELCRTQAENFSEERFKTQMLERLQDYRTESPQFGRMHSPLPAHKLRELPELPVSS